MILTLTPNPTIDRTLFVRGFGLGAVVRAEREVATPSGKGVDASLVIEELQGRTVVLGLSAGLTGQQLAAMLDRWGVAHDLVEAEGETRTATVLVDLEAGAQSTISAATLSATTVHLTLLEVRLASYAGRAWGLICGGSLPPGLPPDSYARLLSYARDLGMVTLLDTSGQALCRGVSAMPDVLKVNHHELAALGIEVNASDLPTRAALTTLSIELRQEIGHWAGEALVITLGASGAVMVTAGAAYWARPPQVPASNTAGAGDALSGGLMLARSRGSDWPEALALGTAAAASVVMNPGTAVCYRKEVYELLPQVTVERLDEFEGESDRRISGQGGSDNGDDFASSGG
jgi:1-phosphofructokinase family hexose kinase